MPEIEARSSKQKNIPKPSIGQNLQLCSSCISKVVQNPYGKFKVLYEAYSGKEKIKYESYTCFLFPQPIVRKNDRCLPWHMRRRLEDEELLSRHHHIPANFPRLKSFE
jgi:hypothetical protein